MPENTVLGYDKTKDVEFVPEHRLLETEHFNVVADDNPLTEGHVLIIPKENYSCIGELPEQMMDEYMKLYGTFSDFIKHEYGSVSSFEHGKIGQTVFHAHVHVLPYNGTPESIIPEGMQYVTGIPDMRSVQEAYKKEGRYLYFSIGENRWTVDPGLGYPRFFRDRFASALGQYDLGDWQKNTDNPVMKSENNRKVTALENKWRVFTAK